MEKETRRALATVASLPPEVITTTHHTYATLEIIRELAQRDSLGKLSSSVDLMCDDAMKRIELLWDSPAYPGDTGDLL